MNLKKIIISSINNKITNSKDINFYNLDSFNKEIPPTLMIGSTGSDSGKTFIVSGITGALTKKRVKCSCFKSWTRCKRHRTFSLFNKK